MEEPKQKSVPTLPWMRSPIDVCQFDHCPINLLPRLDPRLEESLKSIGINSLFPVQVAVWQETIGPGAFERDLCVNSPTGSGKTLAYALPIVQMLSNCTLKCLRALVVLPTRDLALQVKEVFAAIAPAVGLRVGLAVGQSSVADEISQLVNRPNLEVGIYDPEGPPVELQTSVDILVATPGRLMDHINTTKGFTLEHLRYLICESKLKPLYLAALLQDIGGEKCIVFTSSVDSTHRLSTLLNSFDGLPFKVSEYSGLQRQSIRSKTLKAFRAGEIQVLVASDAMTRGMDVEGVSNVINYDMPAYIKTYIHRVGRTARAGRTGRCFTILRKDEVKRFKKCLQKADGKDCSSYSLPAGSVEALRVIYYSALEKLKESVESEASRWHSARSKSVQSRKTKEDVNRTYN